MVTAFVNSSTAFSFTSWFWLFPALAFWFPKKLAFVVVGVAAAAAGTEVAGAEVGADFLSNATDAAADEDEAIA